jgi:SsrA-binding protein
MVLMGWEVKAMRAGRAQLAEGYAFIKNDEAFLTGARVAPAELSLHPRHCRPGS